MISADEVRRFQKNNAMDMDYCETQIRSAMQSTNVAGVLFRYGELMFAEKTCKDLKTFGYDVNILGTEYIFIGWGTK